MKHAASESRISATDLEMKLRAVEDALRLLERLILAHEGRHSPDLPVSWEKKITQLLQSRRIRDEQLGSDIFCDPAWEILLQALSAELSGRRVTISELCHLSGLPVSTCARWVKTLIARGWLSDELQTDRCHIELTPGGSARLRAYFDAVWTTILPI